MAGTADTGCLPGCADFLKRGTKSDAGVWSPFEKGRPDLLALSMPEIRDQGRRGLMGIQMTAVCVEATIPGKKKKEKRYRLPAEGEAMLADIQVEDIERVYESIPYGVIDEPLPPQGSLGFRVQLYGLVNWRQFFLPRQLLAAGIFAKHTRAAIANLRETQPDHAEGIGVCLAIIFTETVDYMTTGCRWRDDHQKVAGTIAGYKLPMVWDFAEANPITESDRLYRAAIRAVSDAIGAFMRACAKAPDAPSVRCISSLAAELTDQDLCFTDPPYYDAIPYADLNFFRIWQKRIIGDFNPEFREVFERPSPTWDSRTHRRMRFGATSLQPRFGYFAIPARRNSSFTRANSRRRRDREELTPFCELRGKSARHRSRAFRRFQVRAKTTLA